MEDFNKFYPGKLEYDNFVKRLKEIELMDINERSKYCISVYNLYNKGIPYRDRASALYCYYLVMPLEGEIDFSNDEMEKARNTIIQSFNPDNLLYLRLLDADKLFQTCQIRGDILSAGLFSSWYYGTKKDLKENWPIIHEDAEGFILNEPCLPIKFIEEYSNAIYVADRENNKARIYELASLVLRYSTDISSIKQAELVVNDPEFLRAYKKETLAASDIQKLNYLEGLENEIESELGGAIRISGSVRKAVGMLVKAGREARAAQKEYQHDWIIRIKRTVGAADNYIQGYGEFLSSFVYLGTNDLKKGMKSLVRAYNLGFDPSMAQGILYDTCIAVGKSNESVNYAQMLLDNIGYTGVEDVKEIEKFYDCYLTIKKTGKEPLSAERIWKRIAEENKGKENELIEELKPNVEQFRIEDKERRELNGIKIIDSMILPQIVEKGFQVAGDYDKIVLQAPTNDLLDNSLEELELFFNAGAESLIKMYQGNINLMEFLNYYEKVIENRSEKFLDHLEDNLNKYPNFAGCIPIVKRYVAKLVSLGKQAEVETIIKHAITLREGLKSSLLYETIKPYLDILIEPMQKIKKVEILSILRPLLQESEYKIATAEMINSYIEVINNEKSLTKKDKLLNDAEKERLDDNKLREMRKEIDDLLSKRKKFLQKITLIAGGIVIVVVIILILI